MAYKITRSKMPTRSFVHKGKTQMVIEKDNKTDVIKPNKRLSAKYPKVSKRKTIE